MSNKTTWSDVKAEWENTKKEWRKTKGEMAEEVATTRLEMKTTKEVEVPKVMNMNHVYLDVVIAVFFMLTLIGAPLGLFFGTTAILKYKIIRKQRKETR